MRSAVLLACIMAFSSAPGQEKAQNKYRVVIMTDMTHDDGNSLIRYLHYSNEFDTEAIIVTPQLPDYNFDDNGPWNKVSSILDAYQKDYPLLRRHHHDFPEYEQLVGVTKKGRGALPIIWLTNTKQFRGKIAERHVESSWGDIRFADWIGEGNNPNGESKDSEGSEFLQQVFSREDDRPIFVQMWGGPITFVQALYRYRKRNTEQKFQQLLGKLHIYGILLQDITFDYMIDLDQVRATQCDNLGTVVSTNAGERVRPRWLLNDAGHFWRYITVMKEAEVKGHGAMSDLYDHGGEGDTPAFLYLLSALRGLNDPSDPAMGSWGTMFRPMGGEFPKGYYSTCTVERKELERWIPEAKNSFLNRLLYCVKPPDQVNREPIAVINSDHSSNIIRIQTRPNRKIKLDASRSKDPDNNKLSFRWFYYREASSYAGEVPISNPSVPVQHVLVPEDIGEKEIHIVLEVRDAAAVGLVSYRRVIISASRKR